MAKDTPSNRRVNAFKVAVFDTFAEIDNMTETEAIIALSEVIDTLAKAMRLSEVEIM